MNEPTCRVTVYPNAQGKGHHNTWSFCGKPLFEDAKFCEKHEADRVRLISGVKH